MAHASFRGFASRACAALLAGALLGGSVSAALAQDRPPGQLDLACSATCTARGNDGAYCGEVCWVPDPEVAARSHPVDWDCYTSCRERGGRARDCMPACRPR